MRRLSGQALRWVKRLTGAVFALLVLAGLGAGGLAWRLAQGPVPMTFLAREIEEAVNTGGPTRLGIGGASIAWQGWREGRLSPFEIILSDVRAVDASGGVRAELPDAAVSLSIPGLLRGELAPREIELRRPQLRVFRAEDGSLALDLGSLAEGAEAAAAAAAEPAAAAPAEDVAERLLADLLRPPSEATPLSALRRLRVVGGRLLVVDRQLGRSWALQDPVIDLRRRPEGGLEGEGSAMLLLGGETVPIRLTGSAAGDPARIELGLSLPRVSPGDIARAVPALAPLGALDAPVGLTARATLGADGLPTGVRVGLHAGEGAIDLGEGRGRVLIASLDVDLAADRDTLRLEGLTLRLARAPRPGSGRQGTATAPPRGGPPVAPTVTAQAVAERGGGRWRGQATLGLDAVAFADLDAWWPRGVVEGARSWMTRNITAGTVRGGQWRIGFEAPDSLGTVEVTALSGRAEASGATVHWLRPVPPVEGASGTAEFGLNEIVVRTRGGRQAGTGMQAPEGTLRFGGFDRGPGNADLQLRLTGPVGDLWTLLRHPRLRLLDRRRVDIRDPTGGLDGRLSLAFPLLDALPVEDLRVRATARLTELRIPEVVLERTLERGNFELTVDNDGLKAQGTGQLAEIPARATVEMDFRGGPPTQVTERVTATAQRVDAQQLANLGLDPGSVVAGQLGIEARYESRRNGQGRATIKADLREARLELEPVGYAKPRGVPGTAEAVLALQTGELRALESARVEAPDALLRARAAGGWRGGRPERIEILDSQLGVSRFAGEVRPPPREGGGGEWRIALRGPVLDLRPLLGDRGGGAARQQPAAAGEPGTAFALEARFDRALTGDQGRQLYGLAAQGRVDARGVLRQAALEGRTGERAGVGRFQASLTPQQGGRRVLRLGAEDAGALLHALDLTSSIGGGRLSVTGAYERPVPGAPLAGTAELTEFAVRDAPSVGKVLQAMTLYGLLEAARGPGLGFAQLTAPFVLSPDAFVLEDGARAFSASLGVTAKGRIDRRRNTIDMDGTIVPAYVFNSLLGNLPIIGRLFSPESGGGVFSATFRVQGPLADPQVSVNPLAALTPGFLRGLFRIGEQQGQR